MSRNPRFLVIFLLAADCARGWRASNNSPSRRRLIVETAAFTNALLFSSSNLPSVAADLSSDITPTYTKDGLADRLAQRNPTLLGNKIFNLPPAAQVYPDWLRGTWNVTSSFSGYLFPSQKISKEQLTRNYNVAGFQKCSIAATADVGKDNVQYGWTIDPLTGLEDRKFNLMQQINAYLGYRAVQEVLYDARKNPNRISIDFVDYRTVNAERIELFCNARESESYLSTDRHPIFVCSEYIRQVTFGTGSTPGVPRQVGTNYANFWTWRQLEKKTGSNRLEGNLLTAAYLDPQDPMYFVEPTLPIAIYSHVLKAKRLVV